MKGFRYWLADLISGGELTRAWAASYAAYRTENDAPFKRAHLQNALDRIAALEAYNANESARRRYRIARGEA